MQQLSASWHEARKGKVTASRVADLMRKTKSGTYAASRINYMVELVCERLTGEIAEHFVSNAMAWGTENEPIALAEYEIVSGNMVTPEGFVEHPSIPMYGASPDGLIGDDGLVEAKCPNTATHIKTILGGEIDSDYMIQMHVQMDCTGRQWCAFISYDPRLPVNLQLVIIRVERDADLIEEIHEEVIKFEGELEKLEAKLRAFAETEPTRSKHTETGGMVVTEEAGVTLKQESFLPEEKPFELKDGEVF